MNFYGLIRLANSLPKGLMEGFDDYFEQAMMLYISDLLQSFLKSFRQSLIIILKVPLSASYSFLGNLTACYLVRELVIIWLIFEPP